MKGNETKDVNISERANMLIAMAKHVRRGLYIADLYEPLIVPPLVVSSPHRPEERHRVHGNPYQLRQAPDHGLHPTKTREIIGVRQRAPDQHVCC
jgi:hypothetical protein